MGATFHHFSLSLWERVPCFSLSLRERVPCFSLSLRERVGVRVDAASSAAASAHGEQPSPCPPERLSKGPEGEGSDAASRVRFS